AIRKLAARLRNKLPPADVVHAAETTYVEGAIQPVPIDSVSEVMKQWAGEARVEVGPVDAMWWFPEELEASLEEVRRGQGWVGLYLHGGGYSIGSARDVRTGGSRTLSAFSFDCARDICACLLSVEYSLVGMGEDPTKPFPLQILEALSAIMLIGDSAGGHLVLALQRYLLESTDVSLPGGLILLSPWVDLSVERDRPQVKRLLGPLSPEHLSEPYFSPSLHPPPPGQWPPTLVYYGAAESFAPSIVALVSRLTEAGAPVTSYAAGEILERFSHDFLIFRNVELAWPARVDEAWARIRAWVRAGQK
ncbi:Alpha/Beta hydrolase protein, partial [Cerioporus squamosus]